MKALLLAAGFGTRLAPLTHTIPKCLVPIGGVPLIEYWLTQLISSRVDNILLNTHYLSDIVYKYLINSRWKNNITFFHEETLLGTGGTLLKNRGFFDDETFMVAYADNLTVIDFQALLERHRNRPSGIEVTMVTFTTDSPETCGIVEVDERGIVQKFHEKIKNPPSNKANAAIYLMEPTIFQRLDSLSYLNSIDISINVIPLLLKNIQVWHNNCYLRDIGSIDSLEKANRDVLIHEKLQTLCNLIKSSANNESVAHA